MNDDTCKFCGSPNLWSSFFDDKGDHDESGTYRTLCEDCGEFQDKRRRRKQSSAKTARLDYDPLREMPRYRPGTAPIPSGAARFTHRTWTKNLNSIITSGLQGSNARQIDFVGEVVWAAGGVSEDVGGPYQAEGDILWVEFWMYPNELIIGNGTEPRMIEDRALHVTMANVPVDRIVGVYLPWHAAAWGFIHSRGEIEQVKSGFYDNVGVDYPNSYGKAIEYIKRHSGLRRQAANTFRKTKMGEWVVFGRVGDVRIGPVRVTKKNGQIETKNVVRLGNTFMVNGVPHVYGYLSEPGRQNGGGRYERRYERGGDGWCGGPCPVDGHICTLDHPCHDCL